LPLNLAGNQPFAHRYNDILAAWLSEIVVQKEEKEHVIGF
jgi:hypothetical protein